MTHWNHDLTTAPRGKTVQVKRTIRGEERTVEEFRKEYILAVHASGMVAQSYWVPPRHTLSGALLEGNRWSGFNSGVDPIAWAPWPEYGIPTVEPVSDRLDAAATEAINSLGLVAD